jgi:hypothetical protein
LTFLKADSILVFVCGAKPSTAVPGARDRLVQYAQRYLKHFQFFMAEDVFKALVADSNRDLLSIEASLADLSDCIIIILESEGAFAELGAFTVRDDLAGIVLAINDIEHRGGDSFLSLGPLAKLEKKKFGPVIYGNLKSVLSTIPAIEQRLSKIKRTYNKRLDMSTSTAFHNRSAKHRALFIHDLLRVFAPLKKKDLAAILNTLYSSSSVDVEFELALLEALRLIKRTNASYLLPTTPPGALFFEYHGFDVAKARSAALNHYHKYQPLRCRELASQVARLNA